MTQLSIGDKAPSFTLPSESGQDFSLDDALAAGHRILIYFYPRANTPGCTTEACDFRDSLSVLNGADIQVVGISPDSVDALGKFKQDHELTFPLLSDPEKKVLSAYGAFGEKKNYGKVVQGVIRSTFVVEPDGSISLAKYNVRATGHVARILKDLELGSL